jgi:hypothetical protein
VVVEEGVALVAGMVVVAIGFLWWEGLGPRWVDVEVAVCFAFATFVRAGVGAWWGLVC